MLKKCFKNSFNKSTIKSSDSIKANFDNLIDAIEKSRFTCEMCDGWFGDAKLYEEHMRSHQDDPPKPFQCLLCDKSFKFKQSLQQHSNKHTSLHKYVCSDCNKSFHNMQLLNRHMRNCSNPSKVEQPKSTRKNIEDSDLGNQQSDNHFHIDEGESALYAGLGVDAVALNAEEGVAFLEEEESKDIMDVVGTDAAEMMKQEEERMVDVMEGFEMMAGGALIEDVDTSDQIQIIACQFCGKTFSQASHLRAHVVWHTGSRLYKCLLCDFSFNRLDHLKRHLNTHRGLQPVKDLPVEEFGEAETYLCPLCTKEFRKEEHMLRHVRNVHENEPRFKCKKCGRKYKDENQLKRHSVWHGNYSGRGFKCPLCPSCFRYPSFLMYHMRVHSNERPFPCLSCAKTFKQRSHLKRHMELHSRDLAFCCEFCGQSFGNDRVLQAHVTCRCAFRLDTYQADAVDDFQPRRPIKRRNKTSFNIFEAKIGEIEYVNQQLPPELQQHNNQLINPNVSTLEHDLYALATA